MRWIAMILGILMIIIGFIWALQGANILAGSPMTGDPFWLIVGILVVLVGAALAYVGWRQSRR